MVENGPLDQFKEVLEALQTGITDSSQLKEGWFDDDVNDARKNRFPAYNIKWSFERQ